MLNAPRTSRVSASRYASPTSCECTAWKRRRAIFGTIGIRDGRARKPGKNGPANSRRMPADASRLKIRAGRNRTTAIRGLLALEVIEDALDLGLVA